MRFKIRSLFSLFLAAALLLANLPNTQAEARTEVIRAEELDSLFNRYVAEQGLDPALISLAYVYTPTGETWYHLEDIWYYSASLYKVPLMMLLTEKEYEGALTRESEVCGTTLEALEEEVLVNSDNALAYSAMLYLGQPDVCRRMFCKYSDLPEDYYTWDFYGGSYFTARFMSDVMCTLFREPERFPRMIGCLKRAQPDHYFRLELGDRYEIAQKYGTYRDEDEADWNHATGIIYTPNPFILTVMTRYGGISETILGDLASLFCDYTLQADARLTALTEAAQPSVSQVPSEDPTGNGTAQIPAAAEETGESEQTQDRSAETGIPGPIPSSAEEQSAETPTGQAGSKPMLSVGRIMVIAGLLAAELLLVVLLLARKRRS